jgi:hypothetical protein
MYTCKNFQTKKALKEAIVAGDVPVQDAPYAKPGRTVIEMPWGFHKSYADVQLVEKGGQLVIPQGSKVR